MGRLSDEVIREASLWFVRLGADDAGAADTAAWRRWVDASPQHRAAWDRVEQLGRQFGQVDRQAGIAALDRPRSRGRRQALKVLSLALGAGGLAAAGLQWQTWTAALSTRVGERRSVALDDGSVLTCALPRPNGWSSCAVANCTWRRVRTHASRRGRCEW